MSYLYPTNRKAAIKIFQIFKFGPSPTRLEAGPVEMEPFGVVKMFHLPSSC